MTNMDRCYGIYLAIGSIGSILMMVSGVPTYDLDTFKDGDALHMPNHGIKSGRMLYWNYGNMTVHVVSDFNKQLLIKVENLYSEDGDYLTIYDGLQTEQFNSSQVICNITGRKLPDPSFYLTEKDSATFKFHQTRNCSNCRPPSFKLMFTVARKGPICLNDEFKCTENVCISKSLECDSEHNCGSYTDIDGNCEKDKVMLVAFVVGGICLILVVATICIIVFCKRKNNVGRVIRERRSRAHRQHQVQYSNNPGNPGVFIQPPAYDGFVEEKKDDDVDSPPPYMIQNVDDNTSPPQSPKEPPPPYTELDEA